MAVVQSTDASNEAIVLVLQLRRGLVMGRFSYTFRFEQDDRDIMDIDLSVYQLPVCFEN